MSLLGHTKKHSVYRASSTGNLTSGAPQTRRHLVLKLGRVTTGYCGVWMAARAPERRWHGGGRVRYHSQEMGVGGGGNRLYLLNASLFSVSWFLRHPRRKLNHSESC